MSHGSQTIHRVAHGSHRFIVCACVDVWSPQQAVCHHTWSPLQAGCHLYDTARFLKLPSAFEKLTLCPPFRTHASSFSWLHPSISFTMFCREKLILPLNWDNHGFGKLCPKGLDSLEIKYLCGALGSRCGEMVRDHVGQGYGKISQCLCTSVFAMQRLLAQGCPAKFVCSDANCPRI